MDDSEIITDPSTSSERTSTKPLSLSQRRNKDINP